MLYLCDTVLSTRCETTEWKHNFYLRKDVYFSFQAAVGRNIPCLIDFLRVKWSSYDTRKQHRMHTRESRYFHSHGSPRKLVDTSVNLRKTCFVRGAQRTNNAATQIAIETHLRPQFALRARISREIHPRRLQRPLGSSYCDEAQTTRIY